MARNVVGIGEIAMTYDPEDTIEMIGLGSCAGIFIVAPGRFAVAAHSLLATPRGGDGGASPGKYVATAVPYLLDRLAEAGIAKTQCRVWVVGGAQMFSFAGSSDSAAIGSRNTELAADLLRRNGMRADCTYVGGTRARNAVLRVATGSLEATGDSTRALYSGASVADRIQYH
jgi:chemotaxis protein CheD